MKREREKKITRLHIILFLLVVIAIVIVVVAIKSDGNKKIAKYKKLESDLKTATLYYYKNSGKTVEKGTRKIIKMSTIVDDGYLQDEITNECVGYTIISNYRDVEGNYEIDYESFVKCGDSYQTEGYEADIIE